MVLRARHRRLAGLQSCRRPVRRLRQPLCFGFGLRFGLRLLLRPCRLGLSLLGCCRSLPGRVGLGLLRYISLSLLLRPRRLSLGLSRCISLPRSFGVSLCLLRRLSLRLLACPRRVSLSLLGCGLPS